MDFLLSVERREPGPNESGRRTSSFNLSSMGTDDYLSQLSFGGQCRAT